MARVLLFCVAGAVLAHYVALGTGDLGDGNVGLAWRGEMLSFFQAIGFNEDWQWRMTMGGPGILLAAVVMLWAVWPRRRERAS